MHLLLYPDSGGDSSSGRGMGRWLALLLLALISIVLVTRCVFFVDESEYVYVTQFGQPLRFHRDPGLQFKWPYQSLRRFDRRLQVFEPPAREMLTQDKENLTFAWYVCWRLPGSEFIQREATDADARAADGATNAATNGATNGATNAGDVNRIEQHVARFLQAVGTAEVLENRLEERVQASLSAEIGRLRFEQLVSLDEQQLQLGMLASKVTSELRGAAAEQFGVEVVDVRLKRISYPEAVKPAVFAEIRSERERVAVQYRAEGASEKAKIQSQADLQREQLLSRARRDALAIRGGGEAKAIEIFNQAHSKDPQFYELLKTLDTYRSILDSQTTIVLSADSPLLKLLTRGLPEPRSEPPASPASAAPPHQPMTTIDATPRPASLPAPTESQP